MSPQHNRWFAILSALALLGLHLDFWRPQRAILYGGWMPEELAYRLIWMLLATAWIAWFCQRIWVDEAKPDKSAPHPLDKESRP